MFYEATNSAFPNPAFHNCVSKGSILCDTVVVHLQGGYHLQEPLPPFVQKSRGVCPGGRFHSDLIVIMTLDAAEA